MQVFLDMKIQVKAKAGVHEQKVKKINERSYLVSVKSPAEKGKANEEIKRVLADYLGISYADIKIISGFSAKIKIIEIP